MHRAKICIILVLVAVLITGSKSAKMLAFFVNPDYPGKCVINLDLILSEGEQAQYPDFDCARVICEGDGKGIIHTCGAVGVPPFCTVGDYKNRTADYPLCCEREISCTVQQ